MPALGTEVRDFAPVTAHTRTDQAPIAPIAFDCVKFIVVRAGSARLFSEFGGRHVNVGDVIVLAANTLCGAEPEGWITTTTLYLDRDYVTDLVFWQYAVHFNDRRDAGCLLDAYFAEPAHIVRIGERRTALLMPWLDELTALSLDGMGAEHFYRAQSLLSAILDVVVPYLPAKEQRMTIAQRSTVIPTAPRHRAFRPLRAEAREVAALLRGDLARRWSVSDLANAVHLSSSQLRRVFVEGYGKSPIAYLTMVRTERMAALLRTTDRPVAAIAASVGWGDPDFAARQFRRSVGVSPSEYRRINPQVAVGDLPGVNARHGRVKRA